MKNIINWFVNLCAVWIILAYVIGYFYPETFLWFSKGKWMTWALSLVMFCMGLSLRLSDFAELFKQPKSLVLAAFAQFTIMPLFGWLVAWLLNLPPELAVGFIIVATCPGGMASNLISYIGKANLSLSVVATAISTVLGIFMTPILCKLLAGSYVYVDVWAMLLNVAEMVLIPVALGVLINWKFPIIIKGLGQSGAVISTICVAMVSGAGIAPAVVMPDGREQILSNAGLMLLAATLLHGSGFLLGYLITKLFRFDNTIAKTISCEVGMQNGGLAVTLAKNNFPQFMPMICLPSVFCSIMQSAIGGVLASIWRLRYFAKHKEEQQ